MSNFLSGIAVVLSILAIIGSGFSAYQVFELREELNAIANLKSGSTPIGEPISSPTPDADSTPTVSPTSAASPVPTSTDATNTNAKIQPGQFVQPAFNSKAQVELLSVRRVADPETGSRNVVNMQFRIRRVASPTDPDIDVLNPSAITARNPNTNETYKAVSPKRATPSVDFGSIGQGASADAYVWLQVPQGINTLDIYIPNTQPFKGVPVSN
ncbi:hypothetical protein [Coleofasciculus sp. FACHB-129]|uniref:hypothetical protein n=1 Tax=Cyanophyceae TaxID=3028117 RepID=UPI001681FFCB|nr:hypothetical protein [Coleofasciculus sp. FACHB-129]MBD1898086.1 hypothetical protein [Coleofasciculus sp. FACHB-129]